MNISISIQPITDIMGQLTEAHRQLLAISEQKLSYIKNNDMEELSNLLNKERQSIQKTEQLESRRQKVIDDYISGNGIVLSEKTISQLLHHLQNEDDKRNLEQHVIQLIEVIVQLRAVEQLNEDLLKQSMQFVQTSLDILEPSSKNYNYNDRLSEGTSKKRSIFDSKA